MTDETGSSDADDNSSAGEDDTDLGDSPDLQNAVDEFLDRTDAALAEYDKGYVDADATLHVIQSHVQDLRGAAED